MQFKIVTGYIQTGFKELVDMGGNYKWKNGKCEWQFPLKMKKRVESIIGHPIEFNMDDKKILMKLIDPIRTKAEIEEFKGKGEIKVDLHGDIYVITEYRKTENEYGEIINQVIRHESPKVLRDTMYQVLSETNENLYKNKKIGCRSLACKIMEELGINRFHNINNIFDWSKFFGSRKDYYKYYYLPLKILSHQNMVKHHKNGKISKLNIEQYWNGNGDSYNQEKDWGET